MPSSNEKESLTPTDRVNEKEGLASKDEQVVVNEDPIAVDTKHMYWKVDRCVLVIMMFVMACQFADKLALSSSSVYNVKTDLGLTTSKYSWCSSIFYAGFFVGNIIAIYIIPKVRMKLLISSVLFFWGVTLSASAACKSFAGLMVARTILGILESFMSPSFVYMTSQWWQQDMRSSRTSYWFAGNDIGAIISSFIVYGLGHIAEHQWKWIFLTLGLISVVFSSVVFTFLPNSPETAKFLTEKEKEYYKEVNPTSRVETKFHSAQMFNVFKDLGFWLCCCMMASSILPNSGVISYGIIIINSFGFSALNSTLINLALSVVTWFCITSLGWVASHYKNMRVNMIFVAVIFSIVGGSMIYSSDKKGVKLAGYFLISFQPAITPLLLGMVSSNFKGNTRRSTINSAVFIVYCACNIGGPQLFKKKEAPKYKTAFLCWIVCYAISAVLGVALRAYWTYRNKQLDAYSSKLSADELNNIKSKEQADVDNEEVVEYNDPEFRYIY